MKRYALILLLAAGCATAPTKHHAHVFKSAGGGPTYGSVDFLPSAAGVSDPGMVRLANIGGSLQQSTNGAAFASINAPPPNTQTLAAPANIIDFAGLSGDTDGDYLVTFDLVGGASASGIITVKIDGSAANQATGQWFYTRGSTAGNATTSDLRIDSTIPAGNHTAGSFLLTSKSGKWRFYKASVCNFAVSIEENGAFEDTTTVINDVSINAATAAGFAAGSTATLQKLFRN